LNSTKLNDWIQVFGIFALVASLVFVGIEVRQNSIATRSATNAAVKDAFREFNLVIASSPELARAVTASAADPAAASPADKLQMLAMWRALFHTWSNVHRQYHDGTLDPVLYAAVVQEVSTYAGTNRDATQVEGADRRGRHLRWAWESERFIFNADFQAFIDDILRVER
jgi:hypothetical protein